jgi:TolB-like protein
VLVALALAAGAIWLARRRPAPAAAGGAVRSLAVLPLKPLGGDAADEALGLGIADSIIRGFSRSGAIQVRPLSAVRRYAKSDTDAVAAAVELKTDAVLEGSVQRAGGKLRVGVNLLSAPDGRSIWTESFDVPASEVFEVQDAVSQAVVSRLRVQLDAGQRDRMKKRFTENSDAYEEFVLAASERDQAGPGWGGEHLREAIRRFSRAVQLDPGYALAHARLAEAYVWNDLFFESDAGYLEKANAEIAEAERLDPKLPETHMVRYQVAWSHHQNYDISAALRELRKAGELDPLYGHDELAILYAHIGLVDAFRREAAKALAADPSSVTSRRWNVEGLVLLGLADEALELGKKMKLPLSESRLPMALMSRGLFVEARAGAEALLREAPEHHNAVAMRELVAVVSKERPPDEAAIGRALESGKLKRDFHHTLYALACLRAAQGNAKAAVEMLRRAVQTGMPNRTLFLSDPLLAPIRTSPEFVAFDAELEPVFRGYEREVGSQ